MANKSYSLNTNPATNPPPPLAADAATATNQTTEIAYLMDIDGNLVGIGGRVQNIYEYVTQVAKATNVVMVNFTGTTMADLIAAEAAYLLTKPDYILLDRSMLFAIQYESVLVFSAIVP